jgi:formate/nitrite transporter FocA (FNT family)
MKQIDHDPNEFADKRAGWPSTWLVVGIAWVGSWYFDMIKDWHSVLLGGLTGAILAAWAIDVTGGKVPDSWRSKTPRR